MSPTQVSNALMFGAAFLAFVIVVIGLIAKLVTGK